FRDDDAHPVIAHQEAELFLEVMPEELWPGDRRRIDAGRGDIAVGQAGIDMTEARRLDADLRIAGAEARFRRAGPAERDEGVGEEFRIALVERLEGIDGGDRIVEGARLVRLGRGEGKRFRREGSFAHESL